MGRKSMYKDRAYIRQSEYKTEGYGGARLDANSSTTPSAEATAAARLFPWDRCAITGEPWEQGVPVASFPDGTVFDVAAAVPAIKKSGGRHPLMPDRPLALKDLVRLRYHRVGGGGGDNGDDDDSSSNKQAPFGCPVTGKAFTSSSHIVALRPTGNVFAYEAVDRLCLRARNMKDLLDDTPFSRSDIIHLQDPLDVSGKRAEMLAMAAKASLLSSSSSAGAAGAGGAAKSGAAATATEMMTTTSTTAATTSAAVAAGAAATEKISSLDASALGKDAQKILARISGGSGPGAVAGGRGDRGAGRLLHSLSSLSSSPSSSSQQQKDPRLCAPHRENVAAPAFKPGAATWATDGDASQLSYQMRKEAEKKRKKEEEEEEERQKKMKKKGQRSTMSPPRPYGEEPFKRLAAIAAAASRPVAFTSSVTPLASSSSSSSSSSSATAHHPKFRKPKTEKGYARLTTSLGDLNLELFARAAPRAVENFVVLAKSGYYDGCVFHRSIRNFVAQAGDPTGTGKGGESIYGKDGFPFEESHQSHDARGVVATANAGDRDARNGSQFYVTYRPAPHLDGRHTVFGRVVGGAATTLAEIEKVPTDDDDRPVVPVVIEKVTVFVDPFEGEDGEDDDDDEEQRAAREAAEAREREEGRKRARWFSAPAPAGGGGGEGGGGGGVGRYLQQQQQQQEVGRRQQQQQQQQQHQQRAAPKSKGGFGDFSSW